MGTSTNLSTYEIDPGLYMALFSPTQLWIVALLPPLPMDLLEHPTLAQCTKGQSSTPVTVGMKSPMESPQQQLPVWIMETGHLYQLLVQVWFKNSYSSEL